ncbi:MAG TPA: hypothetical protein PKC24_00895, partial [Cyclobacteriaceae bacterium]|nr:hypothetical protein [Cyclobacteriaceae bacterium]
MAVQGRNTAFFQLRLITHAIGLALLVCFTMPAQAQEKTLRKTRFEKMQERRLKQQQRQLRKDDQAQGNKGKLRQSAYKSRSRQGDRAVTTDPAGRSVRTKGTDSSPARGRAVYQQPNPYSGRRLQQTDRASQSNRNVVSASPRQSQRAWTGDISGRKIRASSSASSARRNPNVYSQSGTFVRRNVSSSERSISNRGTLSNLKNLESKRSSTPPGKRIVPRSASASYARMNVFSQKGPYVRNSSPVPRTAERGTSNQAELRRLSGLQSKAQPQGKRQQISPASASGAYIVKRKVRPYVGKFSKGEKAFTKDVAGRPLRQKNYQSPKLEIIPQPNIYDSRGKMGDKAYKGKSGGYVSATKQTPKAWQGDITGRKIRARSPRDNQIAAQTVGVRKGMSAGVRTASKPSEAKISSALPSRYPAKLSKGISNFRGTGEFRQRPYTEQGANYTGNIKAKAPAGKAAGSISGSWNNNGKAIAVKAPARAYRVDAFMGKEKFSRTPIKEQGANYTGNLKAKPPPG